MSELVKSNSDIVEAKASPEWHSSIPRSSKMPIIGGILVLAATFGGFGYWSVTAPVAGAVVSTGTFVATGQNKIVQHLEGGIIKDIEVKEGDIVEEGQVLVNLDETAAKANLRRLILRKLRLDATAARLRAEAAREDTFVLPKIVTERRADPDVKSIIDSQSLAFETRTAKSKSEVAVFEHSKDALNELLQGGLAQLKSVREQQEILEQEIQAKESLRKQGIVSKTELLRVKRDLVNLTGEEGRLVATVGDSRQRIARANAQIAQLINEASELAVQELHTVSAELDDVREQVRAATDVLDRLTIRAPVNGVVVRLQYHTSGGVIEGGRSVMEILPIREDLVIQTQIRPKDINNVKVGQEAGIRLSGLNPRTTPVVDGKVVYVSADALPNEQRGSRNQSDIYVARVQIEKSVYEELNDFQPTPGMPVEVFIRTRDRTFFDYLTEPIKDSFNRAFRES
ncbi:MAG: HlyD family type I secretion periplasmic adaptor subunit [Pseudomonadota bacterium]